MTAQFIRVALVDDHRVVREGLRVFLESSAEVVIAVDAATGEEALAQLEEHACDVVLLDLVLRQGIDGVATFERVHARWPGTAVLILTSYRDRDSLQYLRNRGAAGYLDKTVEPEDLLAAIRMVAKGHHIWEDFSEKTVDPLTARELQVLGELAEGRSNKEIAQHLGISEKTVKAHVGHILSKLHVYDRTQAVIQAHRTGLIRLVGPHR